jgi:hypothetical protein
MSTYLCEMNSQVWWMVDVSLSHAFEDCPKTQAQKKCLYLEAHASNDLSSALSVERKNKVKMEYGCPERANLLWKVIEQIYGSINSKKSSSSAPENISSSSTLFYQSKEKAKFVSLVKSDYPVSQTGLFSFGKIETSLAEENDCFTSSSNYDDDTNDEYGEQKLLVEFKKLISKHMKL